MYSNVMKAFCLFLTITCMYWVFTAVERYAHKVKACYAAGYNDYSIGYCTHPAKDPVLLSEVEL